MSGKNIPTCINFGGHLYRIAIGAEVKGALKVGSLGQEPEPIKMMLDLGVSDALEKIASVIARNKISDDFAGKIGSQFAFSAAELVHTKISNAIQSDKFEAGVQGWRLNAETGAVEIYGPHRN